MIYEFIFVQAPRKRFDLEHSFGHISPHVPEKGGVETDDEILSIVYSILLKLIWFEIWQFG